MEEGGDVDQALGDVEHGLSTDSTVEGNRGTLAVAPDRAPHASHPDRQACRHFQRLGPEVDHIAAVIG